MCVDAGMSVSPIPRPPGNGANVSNVHVGIGLNLLHVYVPYQ